eukprot:2048264-Pyramimonas_sp.AAC.1
MITAGEDENSPDETRDLTQERISIQTLGNPASRPDPIACEINLFEVSANESGWAVAGARATPIAPLRGECSEAGKPRSNDCNPLANPLLPEHIEKRREESD